MTQLSCCYATFSIIISQPCSIDFFFFKILWTVLNFLLHRWGIGVAKHPWYFIIGSIVIAVTCSIGLISFTTENRPTKLWIPQDSGFVENTEWLQNNFPNDIRLHAMIFTDEDILRPEVLLWVWNEMQIFETRTQFMYIAASRFTQKCFFCFINKWPQVEWCLFQVSTQNKLSFV